MARFQYMSVQDWGYSLRIHRVLSKQPYSIDDPMWIRNPTFFITMHKFKFFKTKKYIFQSNLSEILISVLIFRPWSYKRRWTRFTKWATAAAVAAAPTRPPTRLVALCLQSRSRVRPWDPSWTCSTSSTESYSSRSVNRTLTISGRSSRRRFRPRKHEKKEDFFLN